MGNQLYFGDNLDVLKRYIPDESVDLIYLDPPFNSKATYNVLFAEKSGERSAAQITAFEDTWHWGLESEQNFQELVTQGGQLAELLIAFRAFLGPSDLMAYLVMMAVRLKQLHRVLKPTGNLYLHCDPTASHYLKILIDGIFGATYFRNEIIWKRTSSHNDAKRFASIHDSLLYYAKSKSVKWNRQYVPHGEHYLATHYNRVDEHGRRYRLDNIIRSASMGTRPNLTYEYKGYTPKWGWRVKQQKLKAIDDSGRLEWSKSGTPYLVRFLEEQRGASMPDVWDDIPPVNSQARERLGYPTQKPEALLERVILGGSDEGDTILDPFCGCGTAVSVAEKLDRRWIGIDITHLAITLIRHRLFTAFGKHLSQYEISGAPKDLKSARALADLDRHQFEWWALGLVDARPAQDKRKGPDKGIDGYIYFFVDETGIAKKAVVQVKSGKVNRSMIAILNSDRIREKAEIGIFVSLNNATAPMKKEALVAGLYQSEYHPGIKVPRIQILTVQELLGGKRVHLPPLSVPDTFKKPPQAERRKRPKQTDLFGTSA